MNIISMAHFASLTPSSLVAHPEPLKPESCVAHPETLKPESCVAHPEPLKPASCMAHSAPLRPEPWVVAHPEPPAYQDQILSYKAAAKKTFEFFDALNFSIQRNNLGAIHA